MFHSLQLQPTDLFTEKCFPVFSDNRRSIQSYFQRNCNASSTQSVRFSRCQRVLQDNSNSRHSTEPTSEVTKYIVCPKPDNSKLVSARSVSTRKVNRLVNSPQGMATSSTFQIKQKQIPWSPQAYRSSAQLTATFKTNLLRSN